MDRLVATHERLDELVARASADAAQGRWGDMAQALEVLVALLPRRLALLADALIDLIHEGDHDLVAPVWEQLEDAIRAPRLS
jgi:hypothetical protein